MRNRVCFGVLHIVELNILFLLCRVRFPLPLYHKAGNCRSIAKIASIPFLISSEAATGESMPPDTRNMALPESRGVGRIDCGLCSFHGQVVRLRMILSDFCIEFQGIVFSL